MKVPGVTLFALLAVLIGVPLTGQERSAVAASAVGARRLAGESGRNELDLVQRRLHGAPL